MHLWESSSKFSWTAAVVFFVAQHCSVVGANEEPWNQVGTNIHPSNTSESYPVGGVLQPQRTTIKPTTSLPTSPTTPTTANSHSTEVDFISTTITTDDFNLTIVTPNTNVKQDGLTTISIKKPVTVESSLWSPEAVFTIDNLGPTEIPVSPETVPSTGDSIEQTVSTYNSSDTSVQMIVPNITEIANPVLTSTTTHMHSNESFATGYNATSVITPRTTEQGTIDHQSVASVFASTKASSISTNMSVFTTNYSNINPLSTIPVTSQLHLSATTIPRRTKNKHRTTVSSNGISTPASTEAFVKSQMASNISTKSQLDSHHGVGKVSKQPGIDHGLTDRHVTARDRPDGGDQNDPDLSVDSGHVKDPSDNNNPSFNNRGGNPQITIEPIHYPSVYIQLVLIMNSSFFCNQQSEIQLDLGKVARDIVHTPLDIQAGLIGINRICDAESATADESVTMEFYMTVAKDFDVDVTRKVGDTLEEDPGLLNRYLSVKILSVHTRSKPNMSSHSTRKHAGTLSIEIAIPVGLFALIVFSIGGFVLYKVHKLRVARQTYKDRYYFDGTQLHDSMTDTMKLSPIESKKTAGLHLLVPAINQGLELDETDDITLQVFPSHILSINALAKFYTYIEAIVQEFQTLPDFQAAMRPPSSPLNPRRLAATLPGHHHIFDKRPLSFHSPTRTQVKLENVTLTTSDERQANFVRGYDESSHAYIACQAPHYIADDFWHMVWEQQSKTVILLGSQEEMGTRYLWYWPKEIGIESAQLYGDILIMLQGQVKTENYTVSTLLIKDIQKNLCRHVTHCWFFQWPEMEIPINPRALIVFLMQARQTYQENPGPIVVQCSDGWGRTGTLIAIDTCMRSLEDVSSVDIPTTVSNIRQDRGSAVHNREQYTFIYKVLYEYSTMLIASGCPQSNVMLQPHTSQSLPLRVMYQ